MSTALFDPEVAEFIGERVPNFSDTNPATGRPYIDQNGVRPGPVKLQQFKTALKLRNTPPLYGNENVKNPLVRVKLFDPCGSGSWFITEYSEVAPDECRELAYGYVTGLGEDEFGFMSIEELANVKGRMGIGLEVDCFFTPKPISKIKGLTVDG